MAALAAHPNVVRYDCAWQEEGRFFVQMELCACTLKELTQRGGGGRVPTDTLWLVAVHIARALAHVHAGGVLHLDVKVRAVSSCVSLFLVHSSRSLRVLARSGAHVTRVAPARAAGERARWFGRQPEVGGLWAVDRQPAVAGRG